MARYLALSDMHFGTPESSMNDPRYSQALVAHIVARAPYEEVVLTGDILDANLSILTRAIEGSSSLFGFRHFLQALDLEIKRSGQGKGLGDVARSWVYVPGNHDYKIWDLLSTNVVCEDVLARGESMRSVQTPLAKYRWQGDTSFFAGVFRPFGVQERVTVSYPNHEVAFGEHGTMLFTHGHYLDPSQTRGNDLTKTLRNVTDPVVLENTVRRIVIETAQYQAVANAVSFTRGTRRFINDLVGPEGLESKVRKLVAAVRELVLRLLVPGKASLRGKALSPRMLENIECYVERFCACSPHPAWFVFGHTHRQGRGKTKRLPIEVFNVGSCYMDRDMPITFLEIEAEREGPPAVNLMCVDRSAIARSSALEA